LQGTHETFLVVSAKLLSLLRIFSGHLCVGIPRDAVLTQMGRKAVPRPAHGAALVTALQKGPPAGGVHVAGQADACPSRRFAAGNEAKWSLFTVHYSRFAHFGTDFA